MPPEIDTSEDRDVHCNWDILFKFLTDNFPQISHAQFLQKKNRLVEDLRQSQEQISRLTEEVSSLQLLINSFIVKLQHAEQTNKDMWLQKNQHEKAERDLKVQLKQVEADLDRAQQKIMITQKQLKEITAKNFQELRNTAIVDLQTKLLNVSMTTS